MAATTPPVVVLMALGQFLIVAAGVMAVALLALSPIDPAERQRMFGFMVGFSFIYGGIALPPGPEGIAHLLGLMAIMAGQLQYTMVRTRRAELISGFCSSNVAEAVSSHGLESVLATQKREITAVFCDIRGFTQFAKQHDSEVVLEQLKAFYDVIGPVVEKSQMTIKDYAGDGVLLLCGAPLTTPDHARQCMTFAPLLMKGAKRAMAPWNSPGCPLGVASGVATGIVSLGVIGSPQRLEYSAVGTAINLASRLCDLAGADEICIASSTLRQVEAEVDETAPWESVEIKGVGRVRMKRLGLAGENDLS